MKAGKKLIFISCIVLASHIGKTQSLIFTNAIKLFNESKLVESRRLFNTIGKNSSEYAEAMYYIGKGYYIEMNYNEAIKSFKEAIAANNKNAGYYFMLGNANKEKAMVSNIIEQAILAKEIVNNWEIAAKLDPDQVEVRWDLMNFYKDAPSMFGGDINKAYKEADEINRLNYPDGYEARGYVYESDHKYELAVKSFMEAMKAKPKVLKYYYALAYFYQRQNKSDQALPVFEKIITIDSNEANAHFEIGKAYSADEKMYDQGIRHLSRFIQLASSKDKITICKANCYLGNIYKSKADKAKAKHYYENALSLDPTCPDAKKALAHL